jgi:hypothetical protein
MIAAEAGLLFATPPTDSFQPERSPAGAAGEADGPALAGATAVPMGIDAAAAVACSGIAVAKPTTRGEGKPVAGSACPGTTNGAIGSSDAGDE